MRCMMWIMECRKLCEDELKMTKTKTTAIMLNRIKSKMQTFFLTTAATTTTTTTTFTDTGADTQVKQIYKAATPETQIHQCLKHLNAFTAWHAMREQTDKETKKKIGRERERKGMEVRTHKENVAKITNRTSTIKKNKN